MIELNDNLSLPPPEDTVVLVADDVLVNVQIVGSILGAAGYQVLPARDGEQALRYSKNPSPDLILLDVMMPDLDGFEVCRRLKTDPETAHIPIIFLTAAVEADEVVRGLELGAVDYVTKPFNSTELLARVRTHLELKFSREMLQRTADRLRELNKEKNDFLGIAAHDLKSPICHFIELAEYIGTTVNIDAVELREIAAGISRESRRLLRLVEDLLDMDALERGQLKIQPQPCDLAELVQSVVENFQGRAQGKQQVLSWQAETSRLVLADPAMTLQILDNLISNALKFSPPGKSVRVTVCETEGGVCCAVQDEGPGLTTEDQRHLFSKFARLSARPTAGESSTGLGLSIVKKLLHAMNGTVRCESEPGHGARFIIKLPLAPPE